MMSVVGVALVLVVRHLHVVRDGPAVVAIGLFSSHLPGLAGKNSVRLEHMRMRISERGCNVIIYGLIVISVVGPAIVTALWIWFYP